MEHKNKSFITKFLILICFLIISAIISLFMGTLLSLIIKDPLHTKITFNVILDNIFKKNSLSGQLLFFIIIVVSGSYIYIKYSFLNNSKFLNREDRSGNSIHGQARWQSPSEMAQNFGQKKSKKNYSPYLWDELYKSDFEGYVCNSFKKSGKLYIEGIPKKQACVIGGTGSGKTTGFISPTIQANAISKKKSSMFIYDLKGDLYKMHSKLLKDNGYQTIIINLKEPVFSVKYNPLSLIWDLYEEYKYNKKIVDAYLKNKSAPQTEYKEALKKMTDLDGKISGYITDISLKIIPDTSASDNKIWDDGSRGIIKGLIWAMLEDSNNPNYQITKEKFTLSQLGNILNIPEQRSELFNFLKDRDIDSVVFKKAGNILDNDSEKTVSSYISNTQTHLEKFTEKTIELVTSSSDFALDDILKEPTALFLVIDDTNEASNILASMICSQIRNYLVLKADTSGGSLNRTWYFLLDEFANMPKLDNYGKFTSTDRGRNIFYCAIVQSISQFKKKYSEEEKVEILNNADFQMFLGSNEVESLQYIQKLFGTYTQISRNINISSKNVETGEFSSSLNLAQKNLVNIDELQYMQRGNAYLYIAKMPPCKTTLVPFYDESLHANNTFVTGCIETNILNQPVDFKKTFYDLSKRKRIYLGEKITDEEENYDELHNNDGNTKVIRDTTEEDLYDDTVEVNQIEEEKIYQLLGYSKNEIKQEQSDSEESSSKENSLSEEKTITNENGDILEIADAEITVKEEDEEDASLSNDDKKSNESNLLDNSEPTEFTISFNSKENNITSEEENTSKIEEQNNLSIDNSNDEKKSVDDILKKINKKKKNKARKSDEDDE